jgi:hypothetical protein
MKAYYKLSIAERLQLGNKLDGKVVAREGILTGE